jgi:ATPase family associated with various cellular activities (AAA)
MQSAIDLVLAPAIPHPVATMSADGGHVVITEGDAVRITGGAVLLDAAGVVAAGAVDGATWIVTADGGVHHLHRFDRAGTPAGPAVALGELGGDVAISTVRVGARTALVEGARAVLVSERDGELTIEPLGERGRDRRILIGGRGVAERRGPALAWLRRGAVAGFALPFDLTGAVVTGGTMVLDGAAALVELDRHGQRVAIVYDVRRGEVRSRIRLGEASIMAVAERKGVIVLGRGASVAMFDLRAGCCVGERILPAVLAACAIDSQGSRLVIVDQLGRVSELGATMTGAVVAGTSADVVAGTTGAVVAVPAADAPAPDVALPEEPAPDTTPSPAAPEPRDSPEAHAARDEPDASDESAVHDEPDEPAVHDAFDMSDAPNEHDALDAGPSSGRDETTGAGHAGHATDRNHGDPLDELVAASRLRLGALGPASPRTLDPEALDDYLTDTREWIERLCSTAQVLAGRGDEVLPAAREREQAATEQMARWNRRGTPHLEIARELGLSATATTVLLLIAAPQIWGELAHSYGRCVADPARPLVDELLLAHLLDAGTAARVAIARELDDDAPLVASGAVELGRGLRPYAPLSVHPAIARRLAGGGRPRAQAAVRSLAEIAGPRAAIAAIARQLAAPRAVPAGPVRVVLRGRTGSGRRTLAAALAAQAGRGLGMVAVADAAAAADLEAVLRRRLRDVALRGELPCVELDGLAEEPQVRARVRAVLDAHPGPLTIRAPGHGELPLAPGHVALDFPAPTETERAALWRDLLAARGHDPAIAASLAARFAVGPGAMIRACAALDARGPAPSIEHTLAAALRQHRSARIEAVATRVETLAGWDDLVVPEDIADALREVCARVRHRRLVLEGWGMERAAATALGVTALFQGGPGTGKTMAAGVIARALGYELWRVDLSKVVSKWIGETEKNLAAVFDAAEEGEIVLLFDEADSLFARRTQVTSSNDRNANLETNYLLQRLDSFTGVAVLTTNAGTAIDLAFKRRMSVHVQFPFPDEIDRERLWRAHLPATLPVAGPLALDALARKHQLSGGYIRNACLRAAYLAASDGGALTERHLHRAVALEYQRAGKLADGRLE